MSGTAYIAVIAVVSANLGATPIDLVCESNNSRSAAYRWNDAAGWKCYTPGQIPAAGEWPGKTAENNYIAVLGATTNANVATEHDMNVNATLGVLGKGYAKWAVTGVANNGSGLIRLTTGRNTVATGDKVFCYGFNGRSGGQAYGIWTATSIDSSHFDLQGSSYSGMSGVTGGTCEFPAAVKRQGYPGGATTVGKWWVMPGVTATFRGDVIDTWAYATRMSEEYAMVRCGDSTGGGCNWVWDGSGPVSYRAAFAAASGPVRNYRFVFRGTASAHATVKTNPATRQAYFDAPSFASGELYGDYVDFSNLGISASATAALSSTLETSSTYSLTHFTLANSTFFRTGATLPSAAGGGTWKLAYGAIASTSCSNVYGCFYGLKAPAGETLTIGPAVAFNSAKPPVATSANPGAIVFDRVLARSAPALTSNVQTGRVGSLFKNSIFQAGSGPTGWTFETTQNSFLWNGGTTTNPHLFLQLYDAHLAAQTFDGNVFDQNSSYTWGDGDILDESGAIAFAAPIVFTLKKNLMLPAMDYDGRNPTKWRASTEIAGFGSTGVAYKAFNNTIFATTDSGGNGVLFGHLHPEPAGKMAEFRCNAVVNSPATPSGAVLKTEKLTGSAPDIATPSGVHHNALFNYIDQKNAVLGQANGTPYAFVASARPGASDQRFARMPAVVDMNRRLRTWAARKYGHGFADDDAVFNYLTADPSRLLDIPDLVSWLKAGWVLREPTLAGACSDGTDIGMAATR